MENAPNSSTEGSQGSGGGNERSLQSGVREQDQYLPIANISRIMKKALPANAKISKDAKDMMQECVSEFISFVTCDASEKCKKDKRKTINGNDLPCAMATLGFEDYIEPLRVYLDKYRELEGDPRGSTRGGNEHTNNTAGTLHGLNQEMTQLVPFQGSVSDVNDNASLILRSQTHGHEQHMMYESMQDHDYKDDASTF